VAGILGNDWYDNDDVYIVYVDNGYYVYNQRYPSVGIRNQHIDVVVDRCNLRRGYIRSQLFLSNTGSKE